jgi:NAD(P)-dependent dehydrogenase (short-subunit alcohol dehydrogenase family)
MTAGATRGPDAVRDAMRGKTCLVTGATGGIGRATALELARRGATVIAVARDRARGEAAVTELRARGGAGSWLAVADLAAQRSVRALADEVLSRCERLDVLVNNAGAVFRERTLTADGIEATFALNHLAPFFLTTRLLGALRAAPAARVVTVSSEAHRGLSALPLDNLQGERRYTLFLAYSVSKLANVMFTYELARRLAGTPVTANSLHPGVVRTGIWRVARGVGAAVLKLVRLFMLSPERGAETPVYLATSPEVEGVSGKYFVKKRAVPSSAASYDVEAARRLWEVSEELTATGRHAGRGTRHE